MILRFAALLAVAVALFFGFRAFWAPEQADAGAAMVEVQVPELSGTAKEGEAAFNQYCAACHGANAAGQDGVAPPLIHKVYEPSHHGDMSFVLAAKNGVIQHHWRFGNMPAVEGIKDDEIAQIIDYVRTVQRANGIN